MKKKSVILIIFAVVFLLLVGLYFFISTGLHIETTIYDSIEKKPISQATVKIDDRAFYTDNNGFIQANVPLFFKHKIVVEKNGFKSVKEELSFKAPQKNYQLNIFMEPITFMNILTMAQKDLQSAKSFSFRYTWINNQDEDDQTNTYSLYEISQDGVMHFKWLEDDKAGNLLANREIIKTGEILYYRDQTNNNWQKVDQKTIPSTKLQEPIDILNLFIGIDEPSTFLYDGLDTLFEDASGKLYLQEEKPAPVKDDQGKEIPLKEIKVLRYIANWNVLNGKREIVFYVDEESLRLYKGILVDESTQPVVIGEIAKLKKQTLSFTLSRLNETIDIALPEP